MVGSTPAGLEFLSSRGVTEPSIGVAVTTSVSDVVFASVAAGEGSGVAVSPGTVLVGEGAFAIATGVGVASSSVGDGAVD